jgi:hypothetical protein
MAAPSGAIGQWQSLPFRRHRERRHIDGDVAALAGVGGYLDGGRAHRDIDESSLKIEFGATAMSSVEEAQSSNHPAPSQIFWPGRKSRKKPQRGGKPQWDGASNISRIYRSSATLFPSLLE